MRSIGPSDEIQRISRCGTCQDVAKDSTCSVKSRCAGCGGTWCPGPRCDGLESRWFPWFFLIPKKLCSKTVVDEDVNGIFQSHFGIALCPTGCSKSLVHFPLNLNSGGVWRHSRMRRIHAILLFQLQELQKQAGSWNRNSILHQVYSTQECSNCHKTMTFSLWRTITLPDDFCSLNEKQCCQLRWWRDNMLRYWRVFSPRVAMLWKRFSKVQSRRFGRCILEITYDDVYRFALHIYTTDTWTHLYIFIYTHVYMCIHTQFIVYAILLASFLACSRCFLVPTWPDFLGTNCKGAWCPVTNITQLVGNLGQEVDVFKGGV